MTGEVATAGPGRSASIGVGDASRCSGRRLVRADHAHRRDLRRPLSRAGRGVAGGAADHAPGLRRRAAARARAAQLQARAARLRRRGRRRRAARARSWAGAAGPRRCSIPAFLLLRPIPPLAWIPLAIVWLGLGDAAKVLIIWLAAFVPSVINSYAGVRASSRRCSRRRARSAFAGAMLVREVLLPGAAPMIFTGLAAVAAGVLDHAGGGRADRRDRRARPRALPELARHLPGDDPGRDGRRRGHRRR